MFSSLAGLARLAGQLSKLRRVVVAVLVMGLIAGVSPVAADDHAGEFSIDSELLDALEAVGLLDSWVEVGTIDPRTSLVAVSGGEIDDLRDQLTDQAVELDTIRVEGRRLEAMIVSLDELDAELAGSAQLLAAEIAVAEISLSVIDSALADAAIERYVRGHVTAPVGDDLEAVYADATESTLVDVAVEDLLARHEEFLDYIGSKQSGIDEIDAARQANAEIRAEVRADLDELTPRWEQLEQDVPSLLEQLQNRRMGAIVDGLGLSLVTLDAYLAGEARMAEVYPECGIRWQAIAAIGRVESNHARDKGGTVSATGQLSTPFLGVVLDGSIEGTATVLDTDGGALDGDGAYDRAVGPFQFLPGSWRSTAIDGNGDGVIDINNMYDGTATVGVYLCSRVSPLTTDENLRAAFLTYNFSNDYADEVARWVTTYDEFDLSRPVIDGGDVADGGELGGASMSN